MRDRIRCGVGLVAWCGALGCGKDAGPVEATTRIEVTISTTGYKRDLDGYTLVVGNALPVPVSPDGTYDVVVDPGQYIVQLTGIAPNCIPNTGQLRVTAREGTTVPASFEVSCFSDGGITLPGQLRFLGTTTGTQIPDFFTGEVYFGSQLVERIELNPNGTTLSQTHAAMVSYDVVISTGGCSGGSQETVRLAFRAYTDIRFTAVCP